MQVPKDKTQSAKREVAVSFIINMLIGPEGSRLVPVQMGIQRDYSVKL